MPFTILGVVPERKCFVEVDEYIPLTIHWQGYSRLRDAPQTVVLEAGASLVEFKLDHLSGEIVEVVLVDLPRPETVDAPLNAPQVSDPGAPRVSFEHPSQELFQGAVCLHADGLRIRLAEGAATRGIGDAEVVFGFSNLGHLVEKPYLNRSWNVRVEQVSRRGDLPVVRA